MDQIDQAVAAAGVASFVGTQVPDTQLRRLVLDCSHGTTEVTIIGDDARNDVIAIPELLRGHKVAIAKRGYLCLCTVRRND